MSINTQMVCDIFLSTTPPRQLKIVGVLRGCFGGTPLEALKELHPVLECADSMVTLRTFFPIRLFKSSKQ